MIRLLVLIWAIVLGVSHAAYASQDKLDLVHKRNELIVGVLYQKNHFQRSQDKYVGLDIELSNSFANSLGLKLKVQPFLNINELISALKSKRIDIAANPNLLLEGHDSELKIGPIYSHVELTLISPKDSYPSSEISKIKQPIAISENSQFEKILEKQSVEHAHLIWKTLPKFNAFDIATLINERKFAHGLVRSEEASRLRNLYPTLIYTPLDLPPIPATWLFDGKSGDTLTLAALEFFARAEVKTLLEYEKQKARQSNPVSAFYNSRAFIDAYRTDFPHFESWFKNYSQKIDWKIIASISYQMSRWQIATKPGPRYRSLMGASFKYDESSEPDPEREIRIGSQHLNKLFQQLPLRINEQEKIWFAVASYFLGAEHIARAREITAELGGNPDMWLEVKPNLIQLESARTEDPHRIGHSPGLDALQFVENVRKYRDVLDYLEQDTLLKL